MGKPKTKTKVDRATFPGDPEMEADIVEALLSDAPDEIKLQAIATALLRALPEGLDPEMAADTAVAMARREISRGGVDGRISRGSA